MQYLEKYFAEKIPYLFIGPSILADLFNDTDRYIN